MISIGASIVFAIMVGLAELGVEASVRTQVAPDVIEGRELAYGELRAGVHAMTANPGPIPPLFEVMRVRGSERFKGKNGFFPKASSFVSYLLDAGPVLSRRFA